MLSERKAEIEINLRRQLKYQLMSFRESVDEMRPYSPMDKETTRTLAEPRVLEAHPTPSLKSQFPPGPGQVAGVGGRPRDDRCRTRDCPGKGCS
jgi:hypothetical protein